MGDRKVSRGDPIGTAPTLNAAFCNKLVDMVNWFNREVASGNISTRGRSLESSSGVVKVRNLTGDDQLRGNYVQLGDYLLDDIDHHKHWYEGNLYDSAESGRVAILERAVEDGDTSLVRARILGKCTARIDVTDVDHRFAVPDDGSALFKSATYGDIEILRGTIDSTGEQELDVIIGGAGSDARAITNLGYVTVTADKNFGSTGKFVPIDENGDPTVVVDSGDPGYDADELAAAETEFKSAHQYADCPEGSRIMTFAFPYTQHTMFGDFPTSMVIGLLTDFLDEIKQRPGYGAGQVAYAVGSEAESLEFGSTECPE